MNDENSNRDQASYKNETLATHAGWDPHSFYGVVSPPVTRASTILFRDFDAFVSRKVKYTYGRDNNPTLEALCLTWTALSGGSGTLAYPSGMCAISSCILALVRTGDHILCVDNIYHLTIPFLKSFCEQFNVEVEFVPVADVRHIENRIRPETRLILFESPGSLTFEVLDIPALVAVAKRHKVITIIDDTWSTPYLLRPLDMGVDVSINSATKYVCGHADQNLGLICAHEYAFGALKQSYCSLGIGVSADNVSLALRGLKTMKVRLDQCSANAMKLAEWLRVQSEVDLVLHPAFDSCPGHEYFKRDFNGASGVFSYRMSKSRVSYEALRALFNGLKIFGMGYSWGGYESLMVFINSSLEHRNMGNSELAEEYYLIRISAGLEHIDDLLADLEGAFNELRAVNN